MRTAMSREVCILVRRGVKTVRMAVVVIPNKKILLPPYLVAKYPPGI